jgi:hypothetical protein
MSGQWQGPDPVDLKISFTRLKATWEAEIWRNLVSGPPRQKVCDHISTSDWGWWCTHVIPAMAGSIK